MMDEQNLVASINAYKNQLNQVEAALEAAGEEGSEDLVKLKQDLVELISLTEESLLSLKKSQLLSLVEKQTSDPVKPSEDAHRQCNQNGFDLDSEMAAFKAAIDEDSENKELLVPGSSISQTAAAGTATANYDNSDEEENPNLDEIIGTKCRAPYQNDWGGYSYHNCMIVSMEPLDGHTEPKVRVMFCQPTHCSMLPCPYFLEDRCRFSDDKCRYSHGNVVTVSQLREYLEPDYSKLAVDSDCLVKDTDDLWYKAKVIDIHSEGQMYEVMFDSSERRLAVNITDIIPYDSSDSSRDSSDVEVDSENAQPISDKDSDDEDQLPVYLWRPNQSTSALGEWESHTKGIGSRLMSKMGYVTGQGLGSNSQGRVEPIPIQLLPQGKSLDKIMELKEIAGDQDLYDVLKKQKKKQKKVEEKAAKSYDRSLTRHTVFDFINKKIGHKKGDLHSLVNTSRTKHQHSSSSSSGPVKHITEKQLSSRTDRQLNIHILQTHEEIVRTEKEITRLREAVARNKDREPTVACHLRTKLNRMEDHLRQLQSSQSTIQSHKQSRIDKKKTNNILNYYMTS